MFNGLWSASLTLEIVIAELNPCLIEVFTLISAAYQLLSFLWIFFLRGKGHIVMIYNDSLSLASI